MLLSHALSHIIFLKVYDKKKDVLIIHPSFLLSDLGN